MYVIVGDLFFILLKYYYFGKLVCAYYIFLRLSILSLAKTCNNDSKKTLLGAVSSLVDERFIKWKRYLN